MHPGVLCSDVLHIQKLAKVAAEADEIADRIKVTTQYFDVWEPPPHHKVCVHALVALPSALLLDCMLDVSSTSDSPMCDPNSCVYSYASSSCSACWCRDFPLTKCGTPS